MHRFRGVLTVVIIAFLSAMSFTHAHGNVIDRHKKKIAAAEIVFSEAQEAGIPVKLALAIARIESNFTCRSKGKGHAMGVMQIKPATARSMGFSGNSKKLLDCRIGAHYAVAYLAAALKAANGDQCLAVGYYRAGIQKKKLNAKHCELAQKVMEQIQGNIVASAVNAEIKKPKKKKR